MTWHAYHFAKDAEHAARLLADLGDQARLVAGGTDLLVQLRDNPDHSPALADLTRAPDLTAIAPAPEGDGLLLGAATTYAAILRSDLVWEVAPLLAQAVAQIGSAQIRARGTIGGNLGTATPAGDALPALLALEARLHLLGPGGHRVLPLEEFFLGPRQTALQPEEIIVAVEIPLRPSLRGAFAKFGLRRAQAISVASVAAAVEVDEAGRVTWARVALGAVAPTPRRAPEAESALLGARLTPEAMEAAAHAAAEATHPIDDIRGSAAYRRELVRVLTHRALQSLAEDTAPTRPVEASVARPLPPAPPPPEGWDGRSLRCRVNGEEVEVPDVRGRSLLRVLREDLGLTGTKDGCSAGECGACTVLLDGVAVTSCLVPAPQAYGREVVTVEGLSRGDRLHPVQEAFVDHAATQCGYCTPGMLLSAEALLRTVEQPTLEQVKAALAGNLCRCTGYYQIFEAVQDAAARRNRGKS
ncbi:MAG: FAD binding domain-containing protein [Anaerolineae bacterium]|nr:FAD binding domain-containing protein [Anaerolineae bacterium]